MLKQGVFQVGLVMDQNKSSYTHAEMSRISPGPHMAQCMEPMASAGECCAFSTVLLKKVWQGAGRWGECWIITACKAVHTWEHETSEVGKDI